MLRSFSFASLVCCVVATACGQSEPAPGPVATPRDPLKGPPESSCAGCHPNHVEEWRISPHAYAMRDPVLHAMIRVGQKETEGKLGNFCVQCHAPIGVETGETDVTFDDDAGVFTQATTGLSQDVMAGVSCDVCHSIVSVEQTANAGFSMQRDGVRRATISDPAPAPHQSNYSPLHADSDVCGTCHQVVNDRGVPLERTFMEWLQSPFNGAQSCQQCHMPAYRAVAGPGGPEREVHRHTFVGVDVSLLPEDEFPGYTQMRDLAAALLAESAELSAAVDPDARTLEVTIRNLAGHTLPSGATADREMWLEVIVRDGGGKVVFESGTLDERGDLRVEDPSHTTRPGTDPQLVLYGQKMYFDPSLEHPPSDEPRRRVEFLWEPNAEESRLVPTGGFDKPAYDLGALPAGDYTVDVRLLFRSLPPHLLRLLEKKGGLDPAVKERVPLVEMTHARTLFTL